MNKITKMNEFNNYVETVNNITHLCMDVYVRLLHVGVSHVHDGDRCIRVNRRHVHRLSTAELQRIFGDNVVITELFRYR